MSKAKRVYLCGGINGLTDAQAKDWREVAKELLAVAGYENLDPMRRDYRGREGEPGIPFEIVNGDLVDIKQCKFLIVNASRPSWGTAMELMWAYGKGKRIVAFGAGDKPSPWLKFHCVLVGTVEEAVGFVVSQGE